MKWEYEIVNFYGHNQEDRVETFDLMGRNKWELVCVSDNGLAYFKRPVQTKSKDDKALEGYFGGKVG